MYFIFVTYVHYVCANGKNEKIIKCILVVA